MTKFVMNKNVMKELLKQKRQEKSLKTRELAQYLGIDQALISKFESGDRLPTRSQVMRLSEILEWPIEELLPIWLKQKIIAEVGRDEYAEKALQLVQEDIFEYRKRKEIGMSSRLIETIHEIEVLKNELNELRAYDSYRISQALELEYTFESNRIEGNTLSLKETDLIINEGITISGKSMREHLEAINHNEAINYVKDLVQRKINLSERELMNIHNLVLRGIIPEYAGKYRDVQVMITGSKHIPPSPFIVQKEMEELFIWFNANKHSMHPVLLAAEMHQRIVTIHPFIDGNGRVSRLIMNLILLQHGYVIANIKGDHEIRMRYYESLESAQVSIKFEDFRLFVAEVERKCLQRYLSILK
jgi:fido (protein-threonine AMPylation protein)/predicted transcriptional regulator